MPRLCLALLLLAARAAADDDKCTCLSSSCGLSFGTVDWLNPTVPLDRLKLVPCVGDSDCEDAPQPVEGPYYEGCWTVAEGYPEADLPASLCAEPRRRRLLFANHVVNSAYVVTGDLAFDGITYETALASVDVFVAAVASLCGVDESAVSVVISQARRRHLSRRRLDAGDAGLVPVPSTKVVVEYTVAVETEYEAASASTLIEDSSPEDVSIAVNTAATKAGVDEEFADVETTAVGTPTTEVDDRCFFVRGTSQGSQFWTDGISLDDVGDNADEVFKCAAASLADVSPDRVELLKIEQGSPPMPQVIASFLIAVSGEAQALAVQRRLAGPPPPPPPVSPPGLPGLPPPLPGPFGGKTKADATAAIRACALKKKAPSVWQEASVDPFVGGKEAKIVPERPIPADVQGCCWGSAGGNVGPIEPIEPIPLDPEANEGPPAPPPTPMEMTTTTTMTTAPYNSTA